jgi:AAA ATPase domain
MARHGTFGRVVAGPSGLVHHVRNRLTRVPVAVGDAAPMTVGRRRRALLGRRSERETLDRQLEVMRAGQSSVLILRGEPGIGKTALLEYLLARASGCRVARAFSRRWSSRSPGCISCGAPMLDRLAAPFSAVTAAPRDAGDPQVVLSYAIGVLAFADPAQPCGGGSCGLVVAA